jgi:hypothetical protein
MPGFRALRTARVVAVAAAATLVTTITIGPAAGAATGGSTVTCGGLIAYNQYDTGTSLLTSRLMAVPALGDPARVSPKAIWDDPADGHGEIDGAWSPDGRSIAFVGVSPGPMPAGLNTRLYLLRAGASEPEVLVEQIARGMRHPAWSPDGKRIAYTTSQEPTGRPYQGLSWVNVVDVATKERSFVTGVELLDQRALDLTWSPRGDQLLLTAWQIATGNWTIYSASPDATTLNPTAVISNDPARNPLVLPKPVPKPDGDVYLPVMYPAFLPGGNALLVEHEAADEASTGLELTDPGFNDFARDGHGLPVVAADGFNSQPDFGFSPLQAVYQHRNNDQTESSIALLTLPTGTSSTPVEPADGVLVEQPDLQPVLGCRPWPFRT